MKNRMVYDYEKFYSQNKKDQNFDTKLKFNAILENFEINTFNRPKEFKEIKDIKCDIEYRADIISSTGGITSINFIVDSIEISIKIDDYPKRDIEYEFDLIPNNNINTHNIITLKGNELLPSDPSNIEIDFNNSTNLKDFEIRITFGND